MCHKPRSNDGWLLRYKVRRTEFFVILGHFLLFHPPNNSKNPNFEKMKETPGIITLLQMCIINEDRMMYGSWDIRRDGLSFLSFWVIFCTLIHLTIRKNSNFEKKSLEILSFYICVSQMTSGDICFLRSGVWDSLLSFWAIFCPYNLMTTPKIKIWKNWKKYLEILSFYTCVP